MRKIELVWKDGQWARGVGERVVGEILDALEDNGTAAPDEAYVYRLDALQEEPDGNG